MIVSQTPLRISFSGGGTDLRGFYSREPGVVISSAIDKYVYVVVKRRFDAKLRVAYSRTEIVDSLEALQHELVREALRRAGVHSGLEICTLADVPSEGTGLGSSGSLTVGLLHALYTFAGRPQPPEVLARQACEIEMDWLQRPVGKQDQYIAAYGGLRLFRFLANGEVETRRLELSAPRRCRLEQDLMLFFTGRTRAAADVLQEQSARICDNLDLLRAMKQLTGEFQECLLNGMGEEMGRLLHRGWELKRQLASTISTAEIDAYYQRALEAGATGGKLSGAGGGGFLLLHCPQEHQPQLRAALPELVEMPFRLEERGTRILLQTEE